MNHKISSIGKLVCLLFPFFFLPISYFDKCWKFLQEYWLVGKKCKEKIVYKKREIKKEKKTKKIEVSKTIFNEPTFVSVKHRTI